MPGKNSYLSGEAAFRTSWAAKGSALIEPGGGPELCGAVLGQSNSTPLRSMNILQLISATPAPVWEFVSLAVAALIGAVAVEYFNRGRPSLHYLTFSFQPGTHASDAIPVDQELCTLTRGSDFLPTLMKTSSIGRVLDVWKRCDDLIQRQRAALESADVLLKSLRDAPVEAEARLDVIRSVTRNEIIEADIIGDLNRGVGPPAAVRKAGDPLFEIYDWDSTASPTSMVGYLLDLHSFYSPVAIGRVTSDGSERRKLLPYVDALRYFDIDWLIAALSQAKKNLLANVALAEQIRSGTARIMEDHERIVLDVLVENKGVNATFFNATANLTISSLEGQAGAVALQVIEPTVDLPAGASRGIFVPGKSVTRLRFASAHGVHRSDWTPSTENSLSYACSITLEKRGWNTRRILQAKGLWTFDVPGLRALAESERFRGDYRQVSAEDLAS